MKVTKTLSKLLCLLLSLLLLASLSACGESKESMSEIFAMDSYMSLVAYGKNAEAGIRAASDVIYSLEAMVDPELPTSFVYAINHANGQSTNVPGQLGNIISAAQQIYTQSEGALDITIYPLVMRWGFADGKYYVPSDVEISAEMVKMCFDQLIVNTFPSTGTTTVTLPEYGQISLASCAKGAASATAIEAMRNAGVTSGIVSMNGSVQTLGTKYDGTDWLVGVPDPNNPSSYVGVLSVGETALVTSGGYQRCFTQRNKTYHHILNPKTGYPVTTTENSLASVTIICGDVTVAYCLSTAMYVLGENRALSYWRTYGETDGGGFEMVLVTHDNRIICTSGLIEKFTLANANYTLSYTE